jgi:transposase
MAVATTVAVEVSAKRLDHLGILSSVIKDLGLIELINSFFGGTAPDEEISVGEAIVGMIINGLGFSNRPLSLTPEFFEQIPVKKLFHEGVDASHFNRHKLGRVLDKIAKSGCEEFFSHLAGSVVKSEGISTDTISLDTTSFNVTGEKYEDTDENGVRITHGYSKDHRHDLPQVVQELLVTHDEGIPLAMMCHSGNAADNIVFTERCKELKKSFSAEAGPKLLVADSKLYCEKNAENLNSMPFVTRIPENIGAAKKLIATACAKQDDDVAWVKHPAGDYLMQAHQVQHYDIDQTWVVIASETSRKAAEKRMAKKVEKEEEAIKKELFHLAAQEYGCESDAEKALNAKAKKWKYHNLTGAEYNRTSKHAGGGRPKKDAMPTQHSFKLTASYVADQPSIAKMTRESACFIIGSNDKTREASELFSTYKSQGCVERGFRFLKDPLFFTSSFFLKKASRIQALVTIMTLSLLVYTIAQRRLRRSLAAASEDIPNQIGKPTKKPTLRRVFQMFFGVNVIEQKVGENWHSTVQGVSELHLRILGHISARAVQLYSG